MIVSNNALVLRTLLVSIPLTAFIGTIGCGSGERRYDYSGTVKYKGSPVPEGYIVFEPDASKGNKGGPGRAKILDGKYNTADAESEGVLGGPHTVRISGFDKKVTGMKGGEVAIPKSLFMDYTVSEDLPKKNGTKDFEIK